MDTFETCNCSQITNVTIALSSDLGLTCILAYQVPFGIHPDWVTEEPGKETISIPKHRDIVSCYDIPFASS